MAAINPVPNAPPLSYRIDGNEAVFFRRVSKTEFDISMKSGHLAPKSGGMSFGKHLTTTRELAIIWGQLMVNRGWEKDIGHVLEIRLSAAIAEKVDFVGAKTDGIGACYFASFEQLKNAKLSEAEI